MFEHYEVFARVGESTDIVRKEMYDFEDKAAASWRCAPEGRRSVVRAFVEHRPTTPWKVWYVGAELPLRAPRPAATASTTRSASRRSAATIPTSTSRSSRCSTGFFRALGLRQVDLLLNSIGDAASRPAYLDVLRKFLEDHGGDLSPRRARRWP